MREWATINSSRDLDAASPRSAGLDSTQVLGAPIRTGSLSPARVGRAGTHGVHPGPLPLRRATAGPVSRIRVASRRCRRRDASRRGERSEPRESAGLSMARAHRDDSEHEIGELGRDAAPHRPPSRSGNHTLGPCIGQVCSPCKLGSSDGKPKRIPGRQTRALEAILIQSVRKVAPFVSSVRLPGGPGRRPRLVLIGQPACCGPVPASPADLPGAPQRASVDP